MDDDQGEGSPMAEGGAPVPSSALLALLRERGEGGAGLAEAIEASLPDHARRELRDLREAGVEQLAERIASQRLGAAYANVNATHPLPLPEFPAEAKRVMALLGQGRGVLLALLRRGALRGLGARRGAALALLHQAEWHRDVRWLREGVRLGGAAYDVVRILAGPQAPDRFASSAEKAGDASAGPAKAAPRTARGPRDPGDLAVVEAARPAIMAGGARKTALRDAHARLRGAYPDEADLKRYDRLWRTLAEEDGAAPPRRRDKDI